MCVTDAVLSTEQDSVAAVGASLRQSNFIFLLRKMEGLEIGGGNVPLGDEIAD